MASLSVSPEILAGRDDFPEPEGVAQTFLSAVSQAFQPAGLRPWRGAPILVDGLPTRMSAIRQAGKPALLWLWLGRAAPYRGLPNPHGLLASEHAADWAVGDTAGWATCASPWNPGIIAMMGYSFTSEIVLDCCVPYSNSPAQKDKGSLFADLPNIPALRAGELLEPLPESRP